tara:strand:- start:1799 stop:2293 length:495 start_codon:yes stop_codon:yes gene_type:complete
MELKTKGITGVISTIILTLLYGCVSGGGYETVPRSSAGTTQTIDQGTVVASRDVRIEGDSSQLGLYGGGIMGSALGSTIGSKDGQVLASAGGAVVGAVVGKQVEKALTSKIAQEITIEMDDGRIVVVVQELQEPRFSAGERVSVLEARGGYARVRHEDYTAPQF